MTEPTNILLQNWELPPFDRINTADFEPAIRAAIAEAEAGVDSITNSTAAPSFENTVEALECVSRRLDRVSAIMFNLHECCTSDALQEVVARVEPEITRFALRVSTDKKLFHRMERVKDDVDNGTAPALSTEQQTLLDNTLKSFRRHGVALEGEAAECYRRNEEELSSLKLRFGQNVLADQNAFELLLTDEADLEGLPASVRAAAHEEAAAHGKKGWRFTLAAPSYMPFMTYSARRDLREQLYRAFGSIGGRGNEHDNNEVIRRIITLRAEQARLLGYDTYCDYVLEDRMVLSLPNLRSFMEGLRSAVLHAAQKDLAEVAGIAPHPLMPWDFSFYAEKLKQQRYDFDSELLRPYFPLEAVREGIFALYGRLYGLHFAEDATVPVYHPDVRVFRVSRRDTEGSETPMGLLYLDMFPRESKRSGAWMTEFRGQYGKVRPQIQVVCNFSKPVTDPATGQSTPSLLRFGEVRTFMHEMGHAMHGMLSEVRYESLSGTNVKRDFVEMPSQVMENWCYEPEFLATFARHWQTGEPLPTEYVDKIRAAQNHLAGWLFLRQLNLGFTDMAFHTLTADNVATADGDFKAEHLEAAAMTDLLPRVEGCCTATSFHHIFDGGYASGYYSYKWAEVLDADIFARFKHDGIFASDTAELFRREVLSRGGSEHPAILFHNFMGRDPDRQALLKRMNLVEPTGKD